MGQSHFEQSHDTMLQNKPQLAKQNEEYLSRSDGGKTIHSQQNLVNALIPMIETVINISEEKAILGVEGVDSRIAGSDFELTADEIMLIEKNAADRIEGYKRKELIKLSNTTESALEKFKKNAFIQLEKKFGDSLITRGIDIQNIMSDEKISQLYLNYSIALYEFRKATVGLQQGKLSNIEALKKAHNLKEVYDTFMPLRDNFAVSALAILMQQHNTPVSFLIFGKGHGDGIRNAVNRLNTDSHSLKQLFGTEKARVNLYYFTPKD